VEEGGEENMEGKASQPMYAVLSHFRLSPILRSPELPFLSFLWAQEKINVDRSYACTT